MIHLKYVTIKNNEIIIIIATNKQVDMWNTEVQKLNTENPIVKLLSNDKLCEVDDPKGFLAKCLDEQVLNNFNNRDIPPHELNLKVGDICFLLRTISKTDG